MFINQFRHRDFINPYRTGVKIGNYNEDLYGVELQQKFKFMGKDPKMYLSENHSQFTDPRFRPQTREIPVMKVNEITLPQTSNFDLNIDLTNKNLNDYMKLQKKNEFILDDKNKFYKEEIKQQQIDKNQKLIDEMISGKTPQYKGMVKSRSCLDISRPKNTFFAATAQTNQNTTCCPPIINNNKGNHNVMYDPRLIDETQKSLANSHLQDTTGVLYIKDSGLRSNLVFGHGKTTKDFYKNEYASVNQLSYDVKERTDKFLNPKYKVKNNFMFQPKKQFDDKDWTFRNFKIYQEFTKRFDVPKNLPQKYGS